MGRRAVATGGRSGPPVEVGRFAKSALARTSIVPPGRSWLSPQRGEGWQPTRARVVPEGRLKRAEHPQASLRDASASACASTGLAEPRPVATSRRPVGAKQPPRAPPTTSPPSPPRVFAKNMSPFPPSTCAHSPPPPVRPRARKRVPTPPGDRRRARDNSRSRRPCPTTRSPPPSPRSSSRPRASSNARSTPPTTSPRG